MSNHDFPRLVTRYGADNAAAAAVLLLTLPGMAFVYAGDEIGMPDGPGVQPPFDRAGRDPHRHPMQWEPGPHGGFTTGKPWLPMIDAPGVNVQAEAGDGNSLLALYQQLIALRPQLGPGLTMLDTAPDVVAYTRGSHVVAINTGAEPAPAPSFGEVVIATKPLQAGQLAPHAAAVARS